MVLSHGNGLSIDAYFPFWSRFADRFDLFVHDVRNHGWNPVGVRRAHNLPTFVEDSELILRDIDRRFGRKPRIGVFHSLSTVIALRQAAMGGGGYSALVLFDPPICPPGGLPEDMWGIGRRLAIVARKRPDRFKSVDDFARQLSRSALFERVPREAIQLLARTTLRRSDCGTDYVLRCPREYEAQVNEFFFVWTMTVDWDGAACPQKAIGGDPTLRNSYMPSTRFKDVAPLDYDFVPETSHLLQIEQPEKCAALTLEFLGAQGLA